MSDNKDHARCESVHEPVRSDVDQQALFDWCIAQGRYVCNSSERAQLWEATMGSMITEAIRSLQQEGLISQDLGTLTAMNCYRLFPVE